MGSQQTLHEMRELLRCGVLIPLPKSNKPDKKEWDAAFKAADDAAANRKAQPTVPKDVYDGNMQDNERNGFGVMAYANGDVYAGLWLDNHKRGGGTMKYANGTTYDGGWEADQMNGLGTFISPANDDLFDWKFHGEFQKNCPHSGTLTYKENNTWTQEYADKWKAEDIRVKRPIPLKNTQKKTGVDPKNNHLKADAQALEQKRQELVNKKWKEVQNEIKNHNKTSHYVNSQNT